MYNILDLLRDHQSFFLEVQKYLVKLIIFPILVKTCRSHITLHVVPAYFTNCQGLVSCGGMN